MTKIYLILLALASIGFLGAFHANSAGSAADVDEIIQGDIDCDGDVDANDALGDLRHVAGLDVQQPTGCPKIGTEAAIPGPSGAPGPSGEPGPSGQPGPSGAPGVSMFANVNSDGSTSGKSPGVTVTAEPLAGIYDVYFPRDVSSCAPAATIGNRLEQPRDWAYTNNILTLVSQQQTNLVSVEVTDQNGVFLASAFHLIVAC